MKRCIAPEFRIWSISIRADRGVGETDDPCLLDWFRKHGYTVEEAEGVKGV